MKSGFVTSNSASTKHLARLCDKPVLKEYKSSYTIYPLRVGDGSHSRSGSDHFPHEASVGSGSGSEPSNKKDIRPPRAERARSASRRSRPRRCAALYSTKNADFTKMELYSCKKSWISLAQSLHMLFSFQASSHLHLA